MLPAASLFVLVLLSLGYAQHASRCGQQLGTTVKETGDGIAGRYTVEWCLQLPNATTWNLQLKYINYNDTNTQCPDSSVKTTLKYKIDFHSLVTEKLKRSPCNITCLSKPLDLVFSGCYMTTNQVLAPNRTFRPISAVHRVRNRFKGVQDFNDLKPVYHIEKDSDTMTIRWDLHYIPVLDYSMEIDEYENNKTRKDNAWVGIGENCTRATYGVTCRARAPPPGRCLAAALRHHAPWHNGTLFKDANILHYCAPEPATVSIEPRRVDPLVWWAAGALALALAALAAGWGAHSRLLAALRKRVLKEWTRRYSASAENASAEEADKVPAPEDAPILLLYARDCPPAAAAVAALRDLLTAAAPGRVLDIFSPECMSAYAAAPAAWLQGVLARPGARVVLAQTPAAAALYAAPLGTAACLQEPLLGARVQYRRPHYGDVLLQHALRLVRDAAPLQQEYTRYYVVSLAEAGADVLPALAARRRYVLPAHAAALLRDLRLRAPPAAALARLAAAAARLRDHVRARPDYLRDELVLLPHPQ